MNLLALLREIFMEQDVFSKPKFLGEDLTLHYQKERGNIEMDKIFVATKYSEVEKMVERFKYFSDREHVEVFGELLAKVVEQR